MNSIYPCGRNIFSRLMFAAVAASAGLCTQTTLAQTSSDALRVYATSNLVEIRMKGSDRWGRTAPGQDLHVGDSLRTGPNSRIAIKWGDESAVEFGPYTLIEVLPPHDPGAEPGLHLFRGLLSFFHRDRPGRIRVVAAGSTAGVKGTEFVIAVDVVDNTERATLSVIDGEVFLANDFGSVTVTNRQQAIAVRGQEPQISPGYIIENNVIQWALYYPAVLDLRELPLTQDERQLLNGSLTNYEAGDLLAALAVYPENHQPQSEAELTYYGALLLAAGKVAEVERILALPSKSNAAGVIQRLAAALRQQIATVKAQPHPTKLNPELTTELLAASYYEQSRAESRSLEIALDLAKRAALQSPKSGFAWARLAELEFSFGRTHRAAEALRQSLALAPRNAQALALQGFLLAAQNNTRQAIESFNHAIGLDSTLGNAWLGRGLCRIRRGDAIEGRDDLLIAAALEPQRSLLRSYLAKAYADVGDSDRTTHELALAKKLDARDPTPWLYSALLRRDQNRINEAVRDLEQSIDLNENRALYRSRMLLDQDRALRGANLAAIYRDAGMTDVSVHEAARAVASDYVNYSAHLFLANSYNELRDPNGVNLRYESATFSEYLIANLLAPVGGTRLSPFVSQQEYSRLFARDGLGFSSETTYLSRGAWQQQASQYGGIKNAGYALDIYYRSENGERANNDSRQRAASVQLKQQLTPQDSVYAQAIFSDFDSGDVRQLYDARNASPHLRIAEEQTPNLFAGYHRAWTPQVHTLVLGGRLQDRFSLSDEDVRIWGVVKDSSGTVVDTVEEISERFNSPTSGDIFKRLQFDSDFEAYSAEAQQIVQLSKHTLIGGARCQWGETRTRSEQIRAGGNFPPLYSPGIEDFVAAQRNGTDLRRLSIYAYDQWHIWDPLWVTAGVSYDRLEYPWNIDLPPVSQAERTKSQVSPKAGFVWTPLIATAVRGAYTRSLGGLFYDASVRLEPVQVAGFNQAYRSLIPESVAGAIAGSEFETFNLGCEQKFKSRTYLIAGLELLRSEATRNVGVFDVDPSGDTDAMASQLRQTLDYQEQSAVVSVNQLVGREWAFGARYRLSKAELETHNANVVDQLELDTDNGALLHSLNLYTIFNHASGIFAEAQALWYVQNNYRYAPRLEGDEFWQFNVFGGYRFPRRRAEITIGLLNITDQDYRLNPLNLYLEAPHSRTFVVSVKINF